MTRSIKTVLVYGATGAQGNSVARSLLRSTEPFSVRALTRNASSPKARELADLGAEVIQADGFNLDQMREALTGVWGFWLNTHHQEPGLSINKVDDTTFQKRLVDVAAQAGVKVLINSTCESSTELTDGKAVVTGMDEKNKVFRYALDHKSFDIVIGAIPGWYMENTRIPEYVDSFSGFPLHKDADGYLTFSSPHAGGTNQAPWIAIADDLGDIIHGLFLNPNPYNGRAVQMFSDYITFEEMTVAFQKVTGQKSRFVHVPVEKFCIEGPNSTREEVRDLFRFAQHMNGSFMGRPQSIEDSKTLKENAVAHQTGRVKGSADLMSCEQYFRKYFT